jgi:hypothetical protein
VKTFSIPFSIPVSRGCHQRSAQTAGISAHWQIDPFEMRRTFRTICHVPGDLMSLTVMQRLSTDLSGADDSWMVTVDAETADASERFFDQISIFPHLNH